MAEMFNEEKYLIEELKAGSEEAFKELVNNYKERAFSVAYGFTHNAEEAKDIVQEVFIKVYENIKNFKGSSKLFTWFYRITINVCIDRQRKNKLFKVFSIFKGGGKYREETTISLKDNKDNSPEKSLETTELGDKIKSSIQKLTMKEREVFELKHYQGLKIRDIAEIIKIKEGTVKVLLFRAVHKLQKMLGDELK